MLIFSEPDGDVGALAKLLDAAAASPDVGLVVVLACDANGFTAETIDPALRSCRKPLIGGIFPRVTLGSEVWERGTIVAGLHCRASVATVEGIDDPRGDLEALIEAALADSQGQRGTLFVFVDGLASRIGGLIDALFNTFGLDINYLGGGAGSLSLRRHPCVMSNGGLLSGAAVLALTDIHAGIGVAHGWNPISRPFKVTESDGGTIVSLDWEPAFEVYRGVVEPHAGQAFAATPFFDLAKAYPFGIAKLDNEMVVRDPVFEDGGRLTCLAEVPRGAYVHVLHGDAPGLLAAARHAGDIAQASYRGTSPQPSVFLIDCISRVLFLQDAFSAELAAVRANRPLIGALTLGEIANSGREVLEFYNKTSVVGLIDA